MPSEKPHHELPCRAAPFEALYAPAQCFAALPVSLHRPAMIDIGYCRAGDGGRSGRSAQKVKCGQFQLCSDFLAGSSFRPRAPAVQEPAALPNGQKEGGLAIHTVLLCLFGRSATWGNACAAPSSSPESGTCRSLRLPNRPFFDRNRPFPRHGRGSPSQPPPLMACARAARISSACLQHQTEGPMRAHRWRMQGRRRSRGGYEAGGGTKQGGVRSRGGTKQGGTKQGDTRQGDVPRKTERLLLRPVRMQNLASLHEETRSSVAKPPLRPYRLRRRRTCNHYLPAGAPGK